MQQSGSVPYKTGLAFVCPVVRKKYYSNLLKKLEQSFPWDFLCLLDKNIHTHPTIKFPTGYNTSESSDYTGKPTKVAKPLLLIHIVESTSNNY